MRGGQAAGIASMMSGGSAAGAAAPADPEAGAVSADGVAAPLLLKSARRRLVNTKRGDMPLALRKLYTAEAGNSYPSGAKCAAFIGHTR